MNEFMVGMQGDEIIILAFTRKLSKEQALNLASYLVALADPDASSCLNRDAGVGAESTAFQKALTEALS